MRELMNASFLSLFVACFAMPVLRMAQNPSATSPAVPGQSEPGTESSGARIGFVSIQQVLATCEEGKAESAMWQQWAEARRVELQNRQKELDALKTKLDVQGTRLTEDALAELGDDIEVQETSLQRAQQDTQREADKRQQRFANSIYRKALPIIEKIARQKKLDSVFFIDQNRDAFINPSLMITDEVIKAFDAAYPAEAAENPIKK
jgi:Skp family chaperone for outer membrane proteins